MWHSYTGGHVVLEPGHCTLMNFSLPHLTEVCRSLLVTMVTILAWYNNWLIQMLFLSLLKLIQSNFAVCLVCLSVIFLPLDLAKLLLCHQFVMQWSPSGWSGYPMAPPHPPYTLTTHPTQHHCRAKSTSTLYIHSLKQQKSSSAPLLSRLLFTCN